MNQARALQPQPQPVRAGVPSQAGRRTVRQLAQNYLLELTVLAALLLRFAPAPYNISAFLILAVLAFAGRTGTLAALAGVCVVYSANPGFAEDPPMGAGARFVVIGAALMAAAFRGARHKVGDEISIATSMTAAVAAAMLVHSSMFSLFPTLSVFKALLWGAVSLTLISTIRGLTEDEHASLHRFFLLFFGAILIISLAMMPLPEARLRNNIGLQGIFAHPQWFGVFCALAGAYYFGTALGSARPSWLMLGMVALSLLGVFQSAARAGGFALVLGCIGLIGLALARSASFFRQTLPGLFSGRLAVLAGVALLGALLNSGAVQEATQQFVTKNSRVQEVTAAYDVSRGWIIREMMQNIERRPIAGIGLGIQSATHLIEVELDEATGLPLSAPVEKGVMWIALFEELGLLLGAFIFVWILWGLSRSLSAGPAAAAGAIAYFFTNFAEATFFSPGGIGMLGLILFYLALAGRRELAEAVPPPALSPLPAWGAAPPIAAPGTVYRP